MIKRPWKSLALAVAIASATACTTATPYQPYRPEMAGGVHGGYSEQRLAPDRYVVKFHGNDLTSRDRVEGYLLYRAAEITAQNGYDWFSVVDRRTARDVQTYVRPDPFYRPWYGPGYAYWLPSWRYYRRGIGWYDWYPGYGPFWADSMDVTTVESFEAEAEIMLGRGTIPAGNARTFDARKVLSDLGPSIVLPKQP